ARATHTLLLPSLWRELMGPMRGAGVPLRTVVVAGEASGRALVEEHARTWPGVRLENEYGPTEATVWATAARLDGADGVTIGRPIGDVRACVFDEEGRWAPPGVAGELLLAGPTLARGYAGDEGLTAERFVERTWPDGARQRSYRTGDRARLTSAGAFDYLGRVDAQVKVRGQRIELLAVEAALLALPGVREAAAVLFANGARLGAAVVADTLDESAARASLRTALPSAAVPSRIVARDDFPRGRTGKVDRPRITSLLEGREEGTGSTTRALTGAEKQIAALWRGVLGVEAVGPDDDFFSLGGDSLASIRVLARAHRAGLVVEAHEFGDDPTVAGMARAAARRAGDASTPSRAAAPMSAPPTPIQRWFLDLDLPARDHWNVGVEVDGVPASATLESVAGAVSELVDVHDALRLTLDEHGALTAPKAGPPEVVEVPSGADASDAARAVNGSFRLDAPGPLLGALLLRRDGAPSRVLLVAHHLAVDALSLDSLADTLRARLDGSLDRVPVGPSFLAWASALEEIRSAAVLDAARAQWTSQLAALAPGALFHGASPGAVADEVRSDVTLDPTTSDAIVEGAERIDGLAERGTRLGADARRESDRLESLMADLGAIGDDSLVERIASAVRAEVERETRDELEMATASLAALAERVRVLESNDATLKKPSTRKSTAKKPASKAKTSTKATAAKRATAKPAAKSTETKPTKSTKAHGARARSAPKPEPEVKPTTATEKSSEPSSKPAA
ncbi:MAG: AMP-binding protein, partial [Planctomycetota bacterium]